jgi:hypothetical protein
MATDIEPSEAIRKAKQWLASAYSDEHVENIGLEEVRWKDGNWEITLGFNRAWEQPSSLSQVLVSAIGQRNKRDYKLLVVHGADNSVVEMRNRETV